MVMGIGKERRVQLLGILDGVGRVSWLPRLLVFDKYLDEPNNCTIFTRCLSEKARLTGLDKSDFRLMSKVSRCLHDRELYLFRSKQMDLVGCAHISFRFISACLIQFEVSIWIRQGNGCNI